MRFALRLVLAFSLLPVGAAAVLAQAPADVVLAENAWVKLTRADYETALLRLPPDLRGGFPTSAKRITGLLNNLLVSKTLAAQARQSGLDVASKEDGAANADVDRLLAQRQIQRIEEAAGAEFDAKAEQLQPRVRELYLVGRHKYRRSEQVLVSQILFTTTSRTEQNALALAQQTRARVLAGADFADLARELSDDPSAKSDGGRIDWFAAVQKEPAFAGPAFELKSVGDVSEPVRTSAGYHLIRLEGRRPEAQLTLDEAKPQILAELRKQYVNEQREQRINAIRNDPQIKVNQPAVDALLVKVDPKLFKPRPAPRKLPPAPQKPQFAPAPN